ncbi:hypothetical protein E4U53_004337, partial [Claviceps sorghi]
MINDETDFRDELGDTSRTRSADMGHAPARAPNASNADADAGPTDDDVLANIRDRLRGPVSGLTERYVGHVECVRRGDALRSRYRPQAGHAGAGPCRRPCRGRLPQPRRPRRTASSPASRRGRSCTASTRAGGCWRCGCLTGPACAAARWWTCGPTGRGSSALLLGYARMSDRDLGVGDLVQMDGGGGPEGRPVRS